MTQAVCRSNTFMYYNGITALVLLCMISVEVGGAAIKMPISCDQETASNKCPKDLHPRCTKLHGIHGTRLVWECFIYKVPKEHYLEITGNATLKKCGREQFSADVILTNSSTWCYTKYPCNHEGMYTFSDGGKIQDRQCGCLYRDGWVAIGTKVPFSRNDPDLGCKRPETLPPEGQQLSDEYGNLEECPAGTYKKEPGYSRCKIKTRCQFGVEKEGNTTDDRTCKEYLPDIDTSTSTSSSSIITTMEQAPEFKDATTTEAYHGYKTKEDKPKTSLEDDRKTDKQDGKFTVGEITGIVIAACSVPAAIVGIGTILRYLQIHRKCCWRNDISENGTDGQNGPVNSVSVRITSLIYCCNESSNNRLSARNRAGRRDRTANGDLPHQGNGDIGVPLTELAKPEERQPAEPGERQPAQSEEGEPAQSEERQPAQSEERQPAQSEERQPAQSEERQPAQSEERQPAQSEERQPAQSEERQPAQSEERQPAQSEERQPAQPEERQPAQPEGSNFEPHVPPDDDNVLQTVLHPLDVHPTPATMPGISGNNNTVVVNINIHQPTNCPLTIDPIRGTYKSDDVEELESNTSSNMLTQKVEADITEVNEEHRDCMRNQEQEREDHHEGYNASSRLLTSEVEADSVNDTERKGMQQDSTQNQDEDDNDEDHSASSRLLTSEVEADSANDTERKGMQQDSTQNQDEDDNDEDHSVSSRLLTSEVEADSANDTERKGMQQDSTQNQDEDDNDEDHSVSSRLLTSEVEADSVNDTERKEMLQDSTQNQDEDDNDEDRSASSRLLMSEMWENNSKLTESASPGDCLLKQGWKRIGCDDAS